MDKLRVVQGDDRRDATAEVRHRRFGLVLFAIYLLVYAGFIGIAAVRHAAFSTRAIFGMNLAVIYGLGLIGLAFALALLFQLTGQGTTKSQVSSTGQRRR